MKRGYLTEEEKNFIIKNSSKLTPKQLAIELDRSANTIRSFIKRWGLISCTNKKMKSRKNPFELSEREMEVMELLAQGKANNEIMGALFITKATLKTHIFNIYGKLQVREGKETGSELRTRAVLKWLGVL